ncbi:MAG TPA: hypothetical protein VGL08_10340 [Paraburkholderia sp.]
MNQIKPVMLAVSIAVSAAAFCAPVFAQNAPAQALPHDSGASMVKPPATAPGGSNNPDNMPIRKPRKATNDKMMHDPPASAANAK